MVFGVFRKTLPMFLAMCVTTWFVTTFVATIVTMALTASSTAGAAERARRSFSDRVFRREELLPREELSREDLLVDETAEPSGSPFAIRDGVLDLDAYLDDSAEESWVSDDEFAWQLMPDSLIYKSYLAGVKESRFSSNQINVPGQGWLWDVTLGARVGLLRFGNDDPLRPDGFQVDVEGSAQGRLSIPQDVDFQTVDYRAGVALTYGSGPHRFKFAYYHLSSHLGDEFLLKHPSYPRLNFVRDAFVLGYSFYVRDDLRLYAETGWAFNADVSQPWEFQFGVDFAPSRPTGWRGAPFFALNGHLRQEVNYGGNFVVQAGWAWRSDQNGRLLRLGAHYFDGNSSQFAFYQRHEQQIGLGAWYDF